MLFLTPVALLEGGEREDCDVCGMWIDLYMKTRYVISLKNDTDISFCSIACTAKYIRKHQGEVSQIMAADYLSEGLTDAEKAFYLSGSDVPGVMNYTSRIAFSTLEKAEDFQKKHGGSIISFKQALEEIE
jgi:nitrous oxide reductase accessory protein NosL